VIERRGIAAWFGDVFVPVHREGHKFIAAGAGVALLLFLVWPSLGWIAVLATGFVAFFFRDPDRVTPVREGLVIAPADGRIIGVELVPPPQELGFGPTQRLRISIFLSLLDVHVNRSPASGRIERSVYVPGAFVNPSLARASDENERRALIIMTALGSEIAVVQIAGHITRRIVTFVGEGDTVTAGQRIGLIRFGSRVDVYLPPGATAQVAPEQRAIAGETVLADLAPGSTAPPDWRRS
jgi:phosphatidylserine decarboxylase